MTVPPVLLSVNVGMPKNVAWQGTPAGLRCTSLLWHAAVRAVRHLAVPTGGTMSDIPADLRYSQDHLWVRPETGFRVVQLTPPGSACSVQVGTGLTDAAPGSAPGG